MGVGTRIFGRALCAPYTYGVTLSTMLDPPLYCTLLMLESLEHSRLMHAHAILLRYRTSSRSCDEHFDRDFFRGIPTAPYQVFTSCSPGNKPRLVIRPVRYAAGGNVLHPHQGGASGHQVLAHACGARCTTSLPTKS